MLDLFGEVVITLDDVELWLDAVPQLARDSPRRKYYAMHYDLSNKIRKSKLDGEFDLLINKHLFDLARRNSGLSAAEELHRPQYR